LFFAVERAQTDSEIWCVRAAALSRQLQTPWSDNKNTALQLLLEPKPGAEAQIAPCAVFKDEPFYPSHNLIHGPIKDQSFNQVIPTRQSVRLSSTRVLDTPTSHLKYFFKVPMAMTRTFTLSQMTENPAAKVTTLKIAEMNRRPFTHDELKAILRVASTEWRGMILTGLYTGQRLKDIALLTWANLDMERQEIRINTSKTDRRQVLPVAAPLLAYFAELPAGDVPTAPLFPAAHPHGLRANGTAALSTQFHQILAAAGLVVARAADHASKGKGRNAARERSPISFHALRHTATSWLKEAGVTEAVAMDIIGHESKAISTHYTHVGAADKRKAVALLPDITK
jgi:integrase